jgi:hypothetical protein
MAYRLPTRYDSRKSFYGKATVEVSDGKQVLYSFGTKVAEIENGKAKVFGTYSPTTSRHIKEFLLQNSFKAENSKQIMKDYGADKTSNSYSEPITKKETKPTISNMGSATVFRVDEHTEIQAVSEKTKNGFRHVAKLYVDGQEVDSAKANYLNRTWESYEYESVIHNLINKSSYISKENKDKTKKKFAEASHQKIEGEFKSIGAVASLGDVIGGDTLKEKNAFKLRMLKAGLGNKGFEVPEDWDKLTEEEKAKRLDKSIKFLNEGK